MMFLDGPPTYVIKMFDVDPALGAPGAASEWHVDCGGSTRAWGWSLSMLLLHLPVLHAPGHLEGSRPLLDAQV